MYRSTGRAVSQSLSVCLSPCPPIWPVCAITIGNVVWIPPVTLFPLHVAWCTHPPFLLRGSSCGCPASPGSELCPQSLLGIDFYPWPLGPVFEPHSPGVTVDRLPLSSLLPLLSLVLDLEAFFFLLFAMCIAYKNSSGVESLSCESAMGDPVLLFIKGKEETIL